MICRCSRHNHRDWCRSRALPMGSGRSPHPVLRNPPKLITEYSMRPERLPSITCSICPSSSPSVENTLVPSTLSEEMRFVVSSRSSGRERVNCSRRSSSASENLVVGLKCLIFHWKDLSALPDDGRAPVWRLVSGALLGFPFTLERMLNPMIGERKGRRLSRHRRVQYINA